VIPYNPGGRNPNAPSSFSVWPNELVFQDAITLNYPLDFLHAPFVPGTPRWKKAKSNLSTTCDFIIMALTISSLILESS